MVAEALTYYFQAAAFDPALREAVNRVSVKWDSGAKGRRNRFYTDNQYP